MFRRPARWSLNLLLLRLIPIIWFVVTFILILTGSMNSLLFSKDSLQSQDTGRYVDSRDVTHIAGTAVRTLVPGKNKHPDPGSQLSRHRKNDTDKIKLPVGQIKMPNNGAENRKQPIDGELNFQEEANVIIPPLEVVQSKITTTTSKPEIDPILHVERYDLLIPRAAEDAPGEYGKGVDINLAELSEEDRVKYDEGWKRNSYNQFASDMISIRRRHLDYREPQCLNYKYREVSDLPSASVIIIFHNEAWSVLLRTVHSVLDRSPPQLIKEVILVDDCSEFDHLKQPLDAYAAMLGKVKVLHNKKREGLIRARLRGAAVATGDVLIFLDSHCECTPGWLEPMLDRIADDKSNVVCPTIDNIKDKTLKYENSSSDYISIGGFDWSLIFNWHTLSNYEKSLKKYPTDPTRSPTMAGGLFAIDRSYFEHLGTYDPGMDIWGGENMELSFKIWMCGGRLEIIPCSHVGHIFRTKSPYKWGEKKNVVTINTMRVAEVWLDDYKKFYDEKQPNLMIDYGDISSRIELRKRLKCKSFGWFVQNIFPDLFVPGNVYAAGEIRSAVRSDCLDGISQPISDAKGKDLKVYRCTSDTFKLKVYHNQYWYLTQSGEIRRDDICFDAFSKKVKLLGCHGSRGNQNFRYTENGQLYHVISGECLTLSENSPDLYMSPCEGHDLQRWVWERKTPEFPGIIDINKPYDQQPLDINQQQNFIVDPVLQPVNVENKDHEFQK